MIIKSQEQSLTHSASKNTISDARMAQINYMALAAAKYIPSASPKDVAKSTRQYLIDNEGIWTGNRKNQAVQIGTDPETSRELFGSHPLAYNVARFPSLGRLMIALNEGKLVHTPEQPISTIFVDLPTPEALARLRGSKPYLLPHSEYNLVPASAGTQVTPVDGHAAAAMVLAIMNHTLDPILDVVYNSPWMRQTQDRPDVVATLPVTRIPRPVAATSALHADAVVPVRWAPGAPAHDGTRATIQDAIVFGDGGFGYLGDSAMRRLRPIINREAKDDKYFAIHRLSPLRQLGSLPANRLWEELDLDNYRPGPRMRVVK